MKRGQRIKTSMIPHIHGGVRKRLGLGGKIVNLVCQMLSVQCFRSDQARYLGSNPGEGRGRSGWKAQTGESAEPREAAAAAVELNTFVGQ